jgi:glycosyltransferase involved in cell wall biosynthesis
VRPRLLVVGSGPEEWRLRSYAEDLGLAGAVEIRSVPYDEMAGFHPFDIPHVFWEEQFGLVLAEAMAAGLPIVTTTSGAIPEVVAGSGVDLVSPGDWPAIARALAEGPLSVLRARASRIPARWWHATRPRPRPSA